MFRNLGTLRGTGRVVAGDRVASDVRYEIEVTTNGRLKTAQGLISGNLSALGLDAYSATLELNDGRTLDVRIDRLIDFERAHIVVSGPIPGF